MDQLNALKDLFSSLRAESSVSASDVNPSGRASPEPSEPASQGASQSWGGDSPRVERPVEAHSYHSQEEAKSEAVPADYTAVLRSDIVDILRFLGCEYDEAKERAQSLPPGALCKYLACLIEAQMRAEVADSWLAEAKHIREKQVHVCELARTAWEQARARDIPLAPWHARVGGLSDMEGGSMTERLMLFLMAHLRHVGTSTDGRSPHRWLSLQELHGKESATYGLVTDLKVMSCVMQEAAKDGGCAISPGMIRSALGQWIENLEGEAAYNAAMVFPWKSQQEVRGEQHARDEASFSGSFARQVLYVPMEAVTVYMAIADERDRERRYTSLSGMPWSSADVQRWHIFSTAKGMPLKKLELRGLDCIGVDDAQRAAQGLSNCFERPIWGFPTHQLEYSRRGQAWRRFCRSTLGLALGVQYGHHVGTFWESGSQIAELVEQLESFFNVERGQLRSGRVVVPQQSAPRKRKSQA